MKLFAPFVKFGVEARREGDRRKEQDPSSDDADAELAKILLNSSYGKLCQRLDK